MQYQIFDIRETNTWNDFIEMFSTKEGEVLYNTLSYLKEYVSLQTIIVELNYIDKDYRNEFSHLYSKTFRQYPSVCKRLLLFQEKIADIDEFKEKGRATRSFKYIGFIVVRPLEVGKVGRTVLSHENCRFDSNKDYVICKDSFKSHLLGKEFEVIGTPFIQQDSMVMTCAQASIWVAARYMHHKFGFPCHMPYEITDSASTSLGWAGRALPSEGLTVYMMLNALNNMGYSPVFSLKPLKAEYDSMEKYNKLMDSWNDTTGFIYKYIESQIPVILIMPEHAITVIGHTFDPSPKKVDEIIENLINEGKEDSKAIITSHHWVDGFIIHDDRSGPYKILPVKEILRSGFIERGLGNFFPQGDIYKSGEDIEGVIIPLPEKIYLLGSYIDQRTKALISDEGFLVFAREAYKQGCSYAEEFLKCLIPLEKNPLVTRSYFIQSELYKKKIIEQKDIDGLHDIVKNKYLEMKMPRFVWVTEITTKERLSKEREEDRTILGEIILDSTANKFSTAPFVSIHFPGIFIEQEYEPGRRKEFYIPDDKPYRHINR